ncbi:SRPBCC family protein [Halopenitus sp. H-Gu1]|uniref:SRPBCC family protein n=1 Tax=Halopenitus sp. H-Gu1 TaxID=3242697 RepID=UPI00359E5228
MDELVVRTTVYADSETVYEFLVDFPRYARYSEHLDRVRRIDGEGGPGTRYALTFSWWRLTYTVRSEVTDVSPPNRIDWAIRKDIDANGHWRISPIDGETDTDDRDRTLETGSEDGGENDDDACQVEFRVRFDPGSASSDAIDLPRFVSFEWVLRRVIPLVREEAKGIVKRAVADLEGRERPVNLEVIVDSKRL